MENNRIELYKQREFGDVFNATFAFIKQEIKPLGRAILVYILPFVLIQGIIVAMLQSTLLGAIKNPDALAMGMVNLWASMAKPYLALFAVGILGQTMVFSTVASYLKLYHKNEGEISIAALGNEIKSCFLPVLLSLFMTAFIMVIGFMMCILPGIYLGVVLSVFTLAVVLEQKGIGNAFSRSFQLVNAQWWWTFLLLFVSVVLVYMVVFIFQIPASIMGFASIFHSVQNNTNPVEALGPFYIAYTAFVSAVQQVVLVVPILLVAFQYFNLVELRDKTSLNDKINSLGQND
jgi:hypothetical protein